jgi:hypothetical protein
LYLSVVRNAEVLKTNLAQKCLTPIASIVLLSCNNPKAASKANFKLAIQVWLDKHPQCLSIALPNQPRSMFDARPRTDPQLDALVIAGLASKKQVMMENSGWTLYGGPKQIPGTRYDFTAEGRKYAAHPEHSALPVGTGTLCYGVPEVIDIVRYSEPANALGQTMTEVTYKYTLKSVAPWVNNPILMQQFPELAR